MSTNFLWYAGTANNTGLTAAAVTLMSAELYPGGVGLAANAFAVSAGGFINSSFAQSILGEVQWMVGNPTLGGTPAVGACLSGWFLRSIDGSNYEQSAAVPARPADFTIGLPNAAIAAASVWAGSFPVIIPALKFYVLVQNNTGVALSTGATTPPWIKIAPYAMQY